MEPVFHKQQTLGPGLVCLRSLSASSIVEPENILRSCVRVFNFRRPGETAPLPFSVVLASGISVFHTPLPAASAALKA